MEKDTTITIRISESQKERLKALAARMDVSVSWLIRDVLKKFLEENE